MKTSCSILVNFDPGTRIEDAFSDAVELATRLQCCTEFKFNDVTCIAYPNGNAYNGAKEYFDNLKNKYPIAVAR